MDKLWNVKAYIYDLCRRVYPVSDIFSREVEQLCNLLAAIEIENPKVLDIGSGTGSGISVCLQPGSDVILLDKSFNMLTKAKRQTALSRCVLADARTLPFKTGVFDIVTVVGVTEYLADLTSMISEIDRVAHGCAWAILTFAPRRVANNLRTLLGHRLHLLNHTDMLRYLRNSAFVEMKHTHTWLQDQILLTKTRAS